MSRRICVITGSRAEYGLLRMLMRLLDEDPRAELQLIVTGAHLVRSLGDTVEEIHHDGFTIARKVDLDLVDSTPVGVARSLGLGVARIAEVLAELRPDLIVVLGDRYEVLAAAQAALLLTIPVAHLHGGEATEGVIDEAIRHAVTKMSHLHFVATEDYRTRVIQLGEQPDRVFTVGAFGLDGIGGLEHMEAAELSSVIGVNAQAPFLLVTYHPVTLEPERVDAGVNALLDALDQLVDTPCVITKANTDAGGQRVNRLLERYATEHPGRARLVANLGQRAYLNAMRRAAAVVGNSSSGIIEAPAFGVPTVNVGDRQRGRLRASSVIDVAERTDAITAGVRTALTSDFRARARTTVNPYGHGGAAARTVKIVLEYDLGDLIKKHFYDLRH